MRDEIKMSYIDAEEGKIDNSLYYKDLWINDRGRSISVDSR
jgi:hypothetical protein